MARKQKERALMQAAERAAQQQQEKSLADSDILLEIDVPANHQAIDGASIVIVPSPAPPSTAPATARP